MARSIGFVNSFCKNSKTKFADFYHNLVNSIRAKTAKTQETYYLTNKNNYNKILLQALTGISTDVRTPQRAAGW